jgi:hypothetical protein
MSAAKSDKRLAQSDCYIAESVLVTVAGTHQAVVVVVSPPPHRRSMSSTLGRMAQVACALAVALPYGCVCVDEARRCVKDAQHRPCAIVELFEWGED